MSLSISIIFCFAAGVVLTRLFMRVAQKKGIMDNPDSEVKLHKKAVPYLGGPAFIAAAYMGYSFYLLISGASAPRSEYIVLCGGIFILAMGLTDDLIRIRPATKFIFQSLIAIILILFDVRLKVYFLPGSVNIILTYFWIVGMSNAFNLVDIMDGLSGGIAMIGALFLFFSTGSSAFFLVFLAVALMSFLLFNFPPAKIYMGDAGSLTIGYLLAAYSLLGAFTANNKIALISPVLILWLPIYETILVSVLRIKKGKSPFFGSKDHFAFRLKAMGFPTLAILLITYFLSIIMGESALIAVRLSHESALVVYCLLLFFFLLFFFLLSKIDVDSL